MMLQQMRLVVLCTFVLLSLGAAEDQDVMPETSPSSKHDTEHKEDVVTRRKGGDNSPTVEETKAQVTEEPKARRDQQRKGSGRERASEDRLRENRQQERFQDREGGRKPHDISQQRLQDTKQQDYEQHRAQNSREDIQQPKLQNMQHQQHVDKQGQRQGFTEKGEGSHYDDQPGGQDSTEVVYLSEEEEPEYEKYMEGVDLMYSFDANDRIRGFELLQEAAEEGNTRALEIIAYGYIFGSELERNFTLAFEIFSELAEEGHPIGQQGLAFMYSTGIGVNSDQAKAMVYYVFAALGGHQFSQMAMGYRTHMGVGAVQACEGSLAYYRKSAEEVIKKASLISGGIAVSKIRLMDEDDEVPSIYGVSEDEMVHYQSLFTDSGNTRAQFMLGIYYMFGLAGAQRSFQMALKFLKQAADSKFPAAYSLMGRIYAEGSDEMDPDYELAREYFEAAKNLKHGDGYSGLGLLYYEGKGVPKDKHKALELFHKAADRGSAEGHYFLGKMYYNGDGVYRDISKGIKYYQLASHGGHLHAIYALGVINAGGSSGVSKSCSFAVELFKTVSERGKFTRMFTEAQRLYTTGDVDSSFLMYSLLAELGFEEAQSNVAYLLEQGDLTIIDNEEEQLKRALLLWNRAAAQGYHQARVKLGDYYYYGMGTEVSYEAAATQYRMASDKMNTPQAMFNLGYMYEHGEGLEKDYHLAKRYYDLAAETSAEAVVPASLALLKLNIMYEVDHYKEWLDFQEYLGGKWDIYLISVLIGCVVILILWRTRH